MPRRARPSLWHYIGMGIGVLQLAGLLWVGLGRIGGLVIDAAAIKTSIADTTKGISDLAQQVKELKQQQDKDREAQRAAADDLRKSTDATAAALRGQLELLRYDFNNVQISLAARHLYVPPSERKN